jgi:acetyl-CoA carboxylase carboxyl transferase subunit alpha
MTTWLDFEKPVLELEQKIQELREHASAQGLDARDELEDLERKADELRREVYSSLTPIQRVQLARHPRRPYALDYIERIFTEWTELHGDRHFADDPAILGGLAMFEGSPVMVIGQQKGRDTKENLLRRFGMPNPEGYRKALRLMQTADRFHVPIVTLVDTPGAYPGLGAEERGQAEAIAVNLREMARLETPIVTAVIGEGGSGGALAIAVADVVVMFENSVYSVISPEGCASILWRDGKKSALARRRSEADRRGSRPPEGGRWRPARTAWRRASRPPARRPRPSPTHFAGTFRRFAGYRERSWWNAGSRSIA